jgi:hypothetical protein
MRVGQCAIADKINKGIKMKVGDKFLFMYVTHYFTGRVVEITPSEVVIDNAAWIPDTGQFNECIKDGTVAHCQPCPNDVQVRIPRPCITVQWIHNLPRTVQTG